MPVKHFMKQFTSFLDARRNYQDCPMCGKNMRINDKDLAMDYGTKFQDMNTNSFSIYLDNEAIDTITINQDTNELEIIAQAFHPNSCSNYSGLLVISITIDCDNCCQFSCILQLHLDLTAKKLIKVGVNTETLSLEVSDEVHEVKSNYAASNTQYVSYQKDGSFRKTTLPLIPLDLKNPMETVARISKLVIFS